MNKSTKYGIYNIILDKWVTYEWSEVFETDGYFEARIMLERMKELNDLNPQNTHYEYEIRRWINL